MWTGKITEPRWECVAAAGRVQEYRAWQVRVWECGERRVAFPHYVQASASKRRHDGLIYGPGGEDVM